MSTSLDTSTLLAAPASPASDAFDAVVQAANPSHPNHAAWVENFGGSLSRRTGTKRGGGVSGSGVGENGSGGSDHLEQSDNSHRRRRGGSSNTGSTRLATATSQIRLDQYNIANGSEFSAGHSRAHASAVDVRPQLQSGKSSELEEYVSPPMRENRRTSEDISRKRRKKKQSRDKGKKPVVSPPIPPPRTTSQTLHQSGTPEMTTSPLQAYPPSYHSHSSIFRGGDDAPPSFIESPQAPGTSSSHSRNHSNQSRMTAASYTPSPSYTFPLSSPGLNDVIEPASGTSSNNIPPPIRASRKPSKFHEPPTRLSSILGRAGEINGEQQSTTKATVHSNSPTQTISSHTMSGSRNGSITRSVEFALPEDTARRGSLDSYGIRKSFDVIVSPFRGAKKATNRKGLSVTSKERAMPSPPILKSPSYPTEFSPRPCPPSPSVHFPSTTAPLSSVADEGDHIPMQPEAIQPWIPQKLEPMFNKSINRKGKIEAGIHPFTLSPSWVVKGVETMTEEGEDYHDAKSDKGWNDSSAEERVGHRSNGTLTTVTKKKAKKKTPEYHNATRARAKSAVSGLGVATRLFQEKNRSTKRLESSASEIDVHEIARSSLQMPREPDAIDVDGVERVKLVSQLEQQPFSSPRRDRGGGGQAAMSSFNLLSPEEPWKDRYDTNRIQLTSPSNPNLTQMYRDDSAFSPISPNFGEVNKFKDQIAPAGRGTGRGFANAMARMRRDRTPSFNTLKISTATKNDGMEGGNYLENGFSTVNTATATALFGLGIATTPGAEISSVETPQKKWRNRLASFSGKSTKSPKVEEDSRMEFIETPIPPMPAKAMKMLLAKTYPEPLEIDRSRNNREVLENAINQSRMIKEFQTAPMESREFSRKAENLDHVSSPTIHKTLSPALLTQRRHEADEVVSFIGSEDSSHEKKATWNSLSNFELAPDQVADKGLDQVVDGGLTASATMPVNLQITRPSMDVDPYHQDTLQKEKEYKDVRKSFTARRFSFGKPKLSTRASDGGLRKGSPSNLYLAAPPPLPSTPNRGGNNTSLSVGGDDGNQQSPSSRASSDNRRPSWSRARSRPSLASPTSATRGASFAIDRERTTFEYPRSPSTPFKETFSSPKTSGKRFFSVGVKPKNQSKGISSSDFTIPNHFDSSRSEISVESSNGRRREDEGGELNGLDDGFGRAKKASKNLASQMDSLAISSPRTSNSLPPTPIVPQQSSTNDEEAAFDKFLRESAKEDVARVKQIAIRTAQHAQLT